MKKSSDPKGWIRGNTKIGPVLEVTTSYLQGKYGVEIKNGICEQRHFSLVGQNFSWLEKVGHGLKLQQGPRRQQRAGNLRNAVRRFCVENECACFCEPIEG